MTREFYKTGQLVPVTVLKVEKARVIQVIDEEKRGYKAVQLGYGKIKNSKLTKAMKGFFAKKNTEPKKILKEYRVDNSDSFKEGNEIGLEILKDKKYVDVRSHSGDASERVAEARAAILLQLDPGGGKVVEVRLLVLRVALDVHLELRVLEEREVGDEHDRAALVLVLRAPLGARAERVRILLGEHFGEVRVVEFELVLGPLPVEAASVEVTRADGVRAGERDDVLVVEALLRQLRVFNILRLQHQSFLFTDITLLFVFV